MPFSRESSCPRDGTQVSSLQANSLPESEPPGKPLAQLVKNLPAMLETLVQFLDQEGPLEKG